MRAHMSEFGVVGPVGRMGLERLMAVIADREDLRIPADARVCLEMLAAQLAVVKEQILENDRRIRASARETEVGRRLMEIPGVGPLLASAFVASIADPTVFKSGLRWRAPRGAFYQAGAQSRSSYCPAWKGLRQRGLAGPSRELTDV